jgi:transcriptional/translational regulatory protein YebC/TACO1
MFERKGLFVIQSKHVDEDTLYEVAVEAGADDVKSSGELFEVTCSPEHFQSVSDALNNAKISTDVSEITQIPSNTVDLDAEAGKKVLRLIDALEDNDDVQNVTSNFNISDEVMEEVASSM